MRRWLACMTLLGAAAASAQAAAPDVPEALSAQPAVRWTLATPSHLGRPAEVGVPAALQLRFAAAPGVTTTRPCPPQWPPRVTVSGRTLAAPLTLELTPVWGAPRCEGGLLTLPAGERGQYRAQVSGLAAGEYTLSVDGVEVPTVRLTVQ